MILLTYGTRPEYIKIKPLIDEMSSRNMRFKTLFTGQHKDIVNKTADFSLNMIDYEGNRLDSILKNCLSIPDYCFEGITHILVQGDTTSVVGLALTAFNRKIKIIHLEAGLRSWDVDNPYPEENNRKIVSSLANIHLCPTTDNKNNLKLENITDGVHVVGNTVLDNLNEYKSGCEYTNLVLVTMHRRENHELINQWFEQINNLAIKYPNLKFVLPIHPNPKVNKHKGKLTNVTVIPPLSHEDLINQLIKCRLVITDSGGIQEECSFFNKKVLVCRKVTERPESVGLSSFLVNTPEDLISMFDYHISDYAIDMTSPYGDGMSAHYICNIFENNDIC